MENSIQNGNQVKDPMEMLPGGCSGLSWVALGCPGLLWGALGCLGCSRLSWGALGCSGLSWAVLGCSWLLWTALGCLGVLWAGAGPSIAGGPQISSRNTVSEFIFLELSQTTILNEFGSSVRGGPFGLSHGEAASRVKQDTK